MLERGNYVKTSFFKKIETIHWKGRVFFFNSMDGYLVTSFKCFFSYGCLRDLINRSTELDKATATKQLDWILWKYVRGIPQRIGDHIYF